jgi:hypothetical protein
MDNCKLNVPIQYGNENKNNPATFVVLIWDHYDRLTGWPHDLRAVKMNMQPKVQVIY